MGMGRDLNKKHSIDKIKPTETRPADGTMMFGRKTNYHGYDKNKERVIRISDEDHSKLKAISMLGILEYGSSMRTVISGLIDVNVRRFDDKNRERYEANLEAVKREKEIKRQKRQNNKRN